MRVYLRVLILAIVVGLFLSACVVEQPAQPAAPAAPEEAAEPAEAPAEEPVTVTMTCRCVEGGVNNNLVVWFQDYLKPTFEQQMAEAGLNVTVELEEFGGSDEANKERYALDLRVGEGADVMGFDGFWIPEFVEAEMLAPLSEIAPTSEDWEGWDHIPPGLQQLLGYQGERYGIAQGTDVRQIFYRRDLLEEVGIELPWQPTSWEDLLDTARTIKEELPDVTPLQINAGTAMGEATTMQGYDMVLLGSGIHMYDFDAGKWVVSHPALQETLDFYQTVYIDEELGDARLQLLNDGRERSFARFRDGEIAMLVEGDWFWRSVLAPGSEWALENRNELVGWARMPASEPGQGYNGQDFVTISGGTGFVLNPNTENPEAAWDFLAFMFSQDSLNAFQEIEPRIRARDDVPVVGDDVMTAMAETLLPLTTVRPQLPAYPEVSFEAQLATERVVSGDMSPDEAAQAYSDAVTELAGEDNVMSAE